jgi:hypothetical protein
MPGSNLFRNSANLQNKPKAAGANFRFPTGVGADKGTGTHISGNAVNQDRQRFWSMSRRWWTAIVIFRAMF